MLNAREALLAVLQDRAVRLSDRIRHVLTALDIHLPMNTYADWADFLTDLERLDPVWDSHLDGLKALTRAPSDELNGETAVAYEQLLVYFLYRYLTAEDDGRPALLQVRVAFAVMATMLIHAVARASVIPVTEAARLFSSEVEYSEENLERFMDLLEDNL
jgi:lysine-N-methylase